MKPQRARRESQKDEVDKCWVKMYRKLILNMFLEFDKGQDLERIKDLVNLEEYMDGRPWFLVLAHNAGFGDIQIENARKFVNDKLAV